MGTSNDHPRPSVRDVAKAAGVSVGTVSHVLNHPERVSEDTRQRVHDAVDALGFVRSASARQLRQGTSTTVGVIVLDLANPFFMEAAQGIDQRLQQEGCIMTLSSSGGDPYRQHELLRLYESMQVKGIILTPVNTHLDSTAAQLVADIDKLSVPVVLFDHPDIPGIATVGVDDITGGAQAITHLLALGHRRIGFVNGPASVRQAADRWAGAIHAVTTAGLDPDDILIRGDAASFTANGGADVTAPLLDAHPDITALACANDLLAIGAMRVLRARGINIPGDIAITGYDDIAVAAELITPLTSVRQPMRDMGWWAANSLVGTPGASDGLRTKTFRPELVIRESTTGR